jgi:ribosomal protein L37AE/L43A
MQAAAYHTAFKIASAAWDDFRNGTTSPKRVARQVAYQRCMTMLNRIGSTAILRENNRHVALAGLAPAVAPTKPVVDEDDKFECQSCHKEFALDQRDLRFKDDWFCRTCGEKQKPAPSKPVAPPKAAASPKRPSTPEGSVKPVAPTPTPTPRVERGDWTTMPVLSPQPPGTVADESCPAFREFEAAVYAWEGKGLGRMPDPSQFSGMLWVVPKPKPSKAKLG